MARKPRVDGNPVIIESVAYHRNGVCGEGFHAVTFTHENRPMVGVVFAGDGRVAVFDRAKLGEGEIGFGINSWRGDHYEPVLRAAIRAAEC